MVNLRCWKVCRGFAVSVTKKIRRSTVPRPGFDKINSVRLQNTIKNLYKEGANIGNGSTADAIRYELVTGRKVGKKLHSKKGQESLTRLKKIFRDEYMSLTFYEKRSINKIREDINNALKGR